MLLAETKEECIKNNEDNKYLGFLINGEEVIPLFDTPHLFKGIRNNLLNKNLHFKINDTNKIAKSVHIQQFYNLDASDPLLRIGSKLTDAHVFPSKMKRIAQWNIKDNYNLPTEAKDTADLILFLDDLFDSLNVSRKSKPKAKPLKYPITKKSQHEEFWRNALKVLDTIIFFLFKETKKGNGA